MTILVAAAACRAQSPGTCRQGVLEGEVEAGHSFLEPLGEGLAFYLQPIASGWIIRVVPTGSPAEPEYAELATPPYRSVTPLSVSTDFAFRAQDAVGWNPRRFRFAPDHAAFERLLAAYRQLPASGNNVPPAAARILSAESAKAIPAEFRIVDARLIPGTANQGRAAAAVASHFNSTAHTIIPVADSQSSPLGSLRWMRFRLRIDLPARFQASRVLSIVPGPCIAP